MLAYQLHRTGRASWGHVRAAADFLLGFSQDGHAAPYTPQDRWENQSGYSPATIASEIAGLVCAASIARHNGGHGGGAPIPRHGRLVAGARQGLDGDRQRSVLGEAATSCD